MLWKEKGLLKVMILKITSNGKIKINLMKSTKVKELEKISVDIKKVDNINDKNRF